MEKFRIHLFERYQIEKAFIFIGYLPANEHLYKSLKAAGFTCIFKPTLMLRDGAVKGNTDAELVLHAMSNFNRYKKALIVTGDGDIYCLAEYLNRRNKLLKVLIPDQWHYSGLFKRLGRQNQNLLDFMNPLRGRLAIRDRKK